MAAFDSDAKRLFIMFLEEERDNSFTEQLKSTYGRAIKSLKSYPGPIYSGQDAKSVKFIGDKMAAMLDKKLREHHANIAKQFAAVGSPSPHGIRGIPRQSGAIDSYRHAPPMPSSPYSPYVMGSGSGYASGYASGSSSHRSPGSGGVPSLTARYPGSSSSSSSSGGAPSVFNGNPYKKAPGFSSSAVSAAIRNVENPTPVRKPKDYQPHQGSGGYAILVALFQAEQVPGSPKFLWKQELIQQAQVYSNTSMTIPEGHSRFHTAWSAMGMLVTKGLVSKKGNPSKYSLTPKGRELAAKIIYVSAQDEPDFSALPDDPEFAGYRDEDAIGGGAGDMSTSSSYTAPFASGTSTTTSASSSSTTTTNTPARAVTGNVSVTGSLTGPSASVAAAAAAAAPAAGAAGGTGGGCRCGSTTHQRVNSSQCPLNPKNGGVAPAARAAVPAAPPAPPRPVLSRYIPCDNCEESNKANSVVLCHDCNERLCEACNSNIHRNERKRMHLRVRLSDESLFNDGAPPTQAPAPPPRPPAPATPRQRTPAKAAQPAPMAAQPQTPVVAPVAPVTPVAPPTPAAPSTPLARPQTLIDDDDVMPMRKIPASEDTFSFIPPRTPVAAAVAAPPSRPPPAPDRVFFFQYLDAAGNPVSERRRAQTRTICGMAHYRLKCLRDDADDLEIILDEKTPVHHPVVYGLIPDTHATPECLGLPDPLPAAPSLPTPRVHTHTSSASSTPSKAAATTAAAPTSPKKTTTPQQQAAERPPLRRESSIILLDESPPVAKTASVVIPHSPPSMQMASPAPAPRKSTPSTPAPVLVKVPSGSDVRIVSPPHAPPAQRHGKGVASAAASSTASSAASPIALSPTATPKASSSSSSSTSSSSGGGAQGYEPFVLRPGEYDIVLMIDCMEGHQRHMSPATFQQGFTSAGIKSSIAQLNLGDFLWVARERVPRPGCGPREIVLDYVIERKRLDDFAQGIMEGRVHEQRFRFVKLNIRKRIYLIESSSFNDSIKISALQQTAVDLQVIHGFSIKWVNNLDEVASYVKMMTEWIITDCQDVTFKSQPPVLQGDEGDAGQQRPLTAVSVSPGAPRLQRSPSASGARVIYGWTFEDYRALAKKQQDQSVRDTLARQLMEVPQVTPHVAQAIVQQYNTPWRLMKGFTKEQTSPEEILADIQRDGGGTRKVVGSAVSRKLHKLFTARDLRLSSLDV